MIPLSRRLNDANGQFAGVALATLHLKYFQQLLAQFHIGQEGAIALVLTDRLMLRIPHVQADIGRQMPASPLMEQAARQASGSLEQLSPFDQTVRMINFDHARNYPVLVAVATGKDEALGEWRRGALILTAVMLSLCAVIAVAGHFLIRSMQLRARAEAGLRQARDALGTANEKLAHMARDDGLTGIPNRRYFDMRLEKVFAQCQRIQRPLAIVMIDVDHFKQFNDLYGHPAGDECLKRIATALRSSIRRPEDLVARYGGEEMVLLLPETGAAGALCVAETARNAVADLRIVHAGSDAGQVTVSLGVAAWTPQPEDLPLEMLNAADAALYQAKAAGRNRIQLHGS
ncbi:diguanylate cyclase [Xylophilus rhododendri]|uniref:diguanylate cyclase n=1 Tax=Xylophilus rhododendri TaxID=2697032 RepID=A0A857J3A5_9BURK|nr:diguanylate cyclase [Xylophilus rhododendri]QHI98256.1 diguanylate cyclase [Xylophilus rhododendri]